MRRLAYVLVFLAAPSLAAAQDFAIQSANGDYRLQIGLLAHMDGRFAIDDPQNLVVSTFALRRLRAPILRGRVAKMFDFYFNPDWAGGVVNIRDLYLDTRLSTAFIVRTGKGKEPFGLERLQSAQYLMFVERGLPTTVAPDRDIGVQVLGDLGGGIFSYQAGLFNGVIDGGSADLDTNDSKDVVGRIVVRPFTRRKGALAPLAIAVAGSSGEQPSALPSFLSSGRQTFFSYRATASGDGTRHRISPQYSYFYRRFASFGEYVRSSGRLVQGAASADVTHDAVMVTGSLVVTGEAATEQGVRPSKPFDPAAHAWGALQLAVRYHALHVSPSAVPFAAAGSNRDARTFAVGANWYLNTNVRWTVNFERTVFDGNIGAPRPAENVVLIMNQLAF
jgi:phosphate-selective porin OprO/OprP